MARYVATGTWIFITSTNRRRLNAGLRRGYGLDRRQARRLMRARRMLPLRRSVLASASGASGAVAEPGGGRRVHVERPGPDRVDGCGGRVRGGRAGGGAAVTDERTCPHETSEPVDVRNHTTGATVTVARICTACLTQLPAAWGCTRCEWAEIRTLCDPAPILPLTRPCQEHA